MESKNLVLRQLFCHLMTLLIVAVVFSFIYVRFAEMQIQSGIAAAGHFNIAWPFRLRFLIPMIIDQVFSSRVVDTRTFRVLFAIPFVMGSFLLLPAFFARVGLANVRWRNRFLSLLIILACHYCLTRAIDVYYIYDMPSIFFYMLVFLLLTDKRPHVFLIGIPLLLLFSYSRETIIIAAIHALGYTFSGSRDRGWLSDKVIRVCLIVLGIIFVLIGRQTIVTLLGGDIASQALSHDETTQLRLISNTMSIIHRPVLFIQVILIGCGIVFWLPFVYRKLSPLLKGILVSSLPALAALLWAGNYIELRIYNEFVPLMAVLLTQAGAQALELYNEKVSQRSV
jgi:hypothetical protein